MEMRESADELTESHLGTVTAGRPTGPVMARVQITARGRKENESRREESDYRSETERAASQQRWPLQGGNGTAVYVGGFSTGGAFRTPNCALLFVAASNGGQELAW